MAKPAANTIDGKAKPFIDRIENIDKELESLRGKYMAECRNLQEDRKEIFIEVKDAGLPVKAVKVFLKHRKLERKLEGLGAGLDVDEAAAYEQLCDALGELGAAAAKRAGFDPGVDGNEKDLRPRHMKNDAGREAKAAAADSITQKH